MIGAISRAKDELADRNGTASWRSQMIDTAADDEAAKEGQKALEVARVLTLPAETRGHGVIDFRRSGHASGAASAGRADDPPLPSRDVATTC